MLFIFTRFDGVTVIDECLITDILFHDGGVLEATLLSTKKERSLSTEYYLKEKPKKFFASGSYKLIQYTGELRDKFE